MASLGDILEADSVPLVGLGVLGLALPFLIPALRPQFAFLVKSGAKLFLEAEIGAEGALADRIVDAAVDALLGASSHGADEHCKERTERESDRFVSAARSAAQRRGRDTHDGEARYRRRVGRVESA